MTDPTAKQRISPLDGRYAAVTQPLAVLFSEAALVGERWRVEHAWLHCLIEQPACGIELDGQQRAAFAELAEPDSASLVADVSAREKITQHDVKALELSLGQQLEDNGLGLLRPWTHFACTSWDINNLAYANLLSKARDTVLVPSFRQLQQRLVTLATDNAAVAMLARTHSQPASPTTLGKEFAVFATRLERQLTLLEQHVFDGKCNGAVGNYNAHVIALPAVDWLAVTRKFVEGFGLRFAPVTTQIEPYDGMVEFFDVVVRSNRILQDLAQDLSLYTGMDYLRLAVLEDEVGSSTMPHKVNPIAFENAEGNLAMANALLGSFAHELQISRLQRDLSDSTVLRNIGVALGHTLVAWQALVAGLERVSSNPHALAADLDANWQVLAEAIQTVLRAQGEAQAYERLKEATRGQGQLDSAGYQALVKQLVADGDARERLLALTPASYLGLAVQLAESDSGKSTNPE